jgi:hypothetical protein
MLIEMTLRSGGPVDIRREAGGWVCRAGVEIGLDYDECGTSSSSTLLPIFPCPYDEGGI